MIRDASQHTPEAGAAFGSTWLPIIPCTGSAVPEVSRTSRAQLTTDRLDEIVDKIVDRLRAIRPQLLRGAPGILNAVATVALRPFVVNLLKNALRDDLTVALCPNIEGQTPADCKQKDRMP